jgi:cysteine desulfurase
MTPSPLPLPIYLDHNATTPLDPRVRTAMLPYLGEIFGNASSASHAYGWQAQAAVKKAREQVAALLGCRASDVIWTSGATESNNLAILGVVGRLCKERPHVITQATEHKAVLEVCEAAGEMGAEVTVLPVDGEGRVSVSAIEAALRPNTVLVSIMMANNEVGTLQPTAAIAELCRDRKLIFHADAAQAVGKFPVDLKALPIDLLSVSGHKIYGPKGVGALVARPLNRDFELKPLMFGGEQERGLRPGTLNVAGIVGLGEACAIAAQEMAAEGSRLREFQQGLFAAVRDRFPRVRINGPLADGRLCNNLSFSFPDLHPEDLALDLSGVAFSSGSACSSGSGKPSHVLRAMGLSDELARATLRLGLGRFTSADDLRIVTDKLLKMLEKACAH